MKTAIFSFVLLLLSAATNAQTATKEQIISDLPTIEITNGVNLHVISPEPIQFVDLSTNQLTGDMPIDNIARIKITDNTPDSKTQLAKILPGDNIGVITIVGQSFMAQYQAVYRNENNLNISTNIHIQPEDMQPLEQTKMQFSKSELAKFSLDILKNQSDKKPIRVVNDLRLTMQLNNVYVINDYIFLDITFKNQSNLSYDIEGLKFSIDDKKIHKATNSQSVDVEPVYHFYPQKHFTKNYRNIYVFKKFTYPNSKILKIRMVEEQISGRTIEMKVNYSDVLKADTL